MTCRNGAYLLYVLLRSYYRQHLLNAAHIGTISIKAFSNPLSTDPDDDGIPDGDEIMMGTHPWNQDTDGDGILDNLETGYGEDPTIYDVTPPLVSAYYVSVYKDTGITFVIKYDIRYTVTDPGGVRSIAVLKNGIERDRYSYATRSICESEQTYFETDWETLLDALRTASVEVEAGDWNGNYNTTLVYHRSTWYGQWASLLGSNTIFGNEIASDLGLLSGASMTMAEMPEMVIQFGHDPVGYLGGIKDLGEMIASDPLLLADLVAALPDSVRQVQELENPYSKDTYPVLHDRYATAWKLSYVGANLTFSYASSEALSTAKTSTQH